MKRKVIIFGATGLIGRELVSRLITSYKVHVITRNANKAREIFIDLVQIFDFNADLKNILNDSYAVINLSGENIAAKPWTKAQKHKIIDSRTNTSKKIIDILNSLHIKPKVYVQASAIGFYPFSIQKTYYESDEKGNSFLSKVVDLWEKEIELLDNSIRSIILRSGVVLSTEGGMLQKMLIPLKFFVGGPLGHGKQWISWIHVEDEINAIQFLMENEDVNGSFNITSPHSITMNQFVKAIGKILKRPVFLRVPAFVIKFLFGQMGRETILGSQKVFPKKLLDTNFKFKYPTINEALNNLLNEKIN